MYDNMICMKYIFIYLQFGFLPQSIFFAIIIMISRQIPKHICFKHVGEIQRTFKEVVM